MLFKILTVLIVVASAVAGLAQSTPARPAITGISHFAIYTSDPNAADHYYRDIVGAARLPDPENLKGVDYCLSPTQFIEVLRLPPGSGNHRLDHIAFNTADANGMRNYLVASGWRTPRSVVREFDGTLWFEVLDPEGNGVQFVQPGGSLKRSVNAPNAIGHLIVNIGLVVQSRETEDKFYKDLLGLKTSSSSGVNGGKLQGVGEQVPDGHDWLEYRLSADPQTHIPSHTTPPQPGVLDHFAIGVASVPEAYKLLETGNRLTGHHDTAPSIGLDGNYHFNIYDPDDVRLELMSLQVTR